MDIGLPFVTYLCLDHVALTTFSNTHYKMKEGWDGYVEYTFQTNKLVVVFQSFSASSAYGMTRLSIPSTGVIDGKSVAPDMSNTDVLDAKEFPASSHAPYMSVAVPVRKRGISNIIVRLPNNHHLNITTTLETAVAKTGNKLDVTEAVKSSHLPPEAVAAQQALRQAIKKVCSVCTENFQNQLEMHELRGGEDLGRSVALLLFDPF